MAELPTGTVTFLFTDIEGSTRLLRALGAAYTELLGEHNRVLREAVEAEAGVPVGSEGDSLFAAFASAPRAVAAAASAQRELADHAWPEGASVRVRMGVHTGEGTVSEGDYVGLDVHRAARIASAAHGGQVLISEATQSLAEQRLPPGVGLRDLGRHRLKDLGQPEHLFQLVLPGLPADFPPPRTLDATPNNLPTQLTSFVGRGHEVGRARGLLETTRLLTLTGPGGTGKTRLAVQLAADVVEDYPDGVIFVPLAPIHDPDLVAQTIVAALGLQDAGSRPPLERLAEHLRDRRLLLVLDNFEQVLAAGPVVAELLRATSALRVVATSRAALHVSGEQELEVPPLGLPGASEAQTAKSLSQYEAVTLFVQRAVAVKPDFEVTNANAPAVAEICSRLDGLPLAIELAAARVKLLPPQALLARLSKRLDVLAGGSRDLPARQQTLRGAIAWSHDLLEPDARRLFARFGIFVGGATLDAVDAVCLEGLAVDALEGLAGLVDQSLVRQQDAEGEARFEMLATIREFAVERLADEGDLAAIAERHAAYYLGLAEEAAPQLTGSSRRTWLDRLDRENGNFRAALEWSIELPATETALRLGAALWRLWQMRGLLAEGAEWLERVLALPDDGQHRAARARTLEAAGGVAYWRGDTRRAATYYDACLELRRELGDRREVAAALYNASFPRVVNMADLPEGRRLLEESLAICRATGDRELLARVLWGLGNLMYFSGEHAEAEAVLLEDIAMLRQMDDPFTLAWALHTLGLVYRRLGRSTSHAAPLWRESLEHFAAVRDLSGIVLTLADFGLLASDEGDAVRALRLQAASQALSSSSGAELSRVVAVVEQLYPAVRDLDPATVETAVAEGSAMSMDEAVAYALSRPAAASERATAAV